MNARSDDPSKPGGTLPNPETCRRVLFFRLFFISTVWAAVLKPGRHLCGRLVLKAAQQRLHGLHGFCKGCFLLYRLIPCGEFKAAFLDICLECVDYLLTPVAGNVEWLSEVSALEQRIDDMTSDYRRNHLERMRDGECSDEACILYSELLTDFERIGDHILNIAQEMAKVQEHI